ncbi:hypothetical protein HK104_008419 [Borealophlyctis nickersoniae]|nr:hypothetical protein HK104_008419 [Borealophlyctis nickersoniae]
MTASSSAYRPDKTHGIDVQMPKVAQGIKNTHTRAPGLSPMLLIVAATCGAGAYIMWNKSTVKPTQEADVSQTGRAGSPGGSQTKA